MRYTTLDYACLAGSGMGLLFGLIGVVSDGGGMWMLGAMLAVASAGVRCIAEIMGD